MHLPISSQSHTIETEPYHQTYVMSACVEVESTGGTIFIKLFFNLLHSRGFFGKCSCIFQKTAPKKENEFHQFAQELTKVEHPFVQLC